MLRGRLATRTDVTLERIAEGLNHLTRGSVETARRVGRRLSTIDLTKSDDFEWWSRVEALLGDTTVSRVARRTADEGLLMPPKSTFFSPKLRTGLVLRMFDG